MDQYKEKLEKIEAVLGQWLSKSQESNWAEKIFPKIGKSISVESIRFLTDPLNDMVSRGGKRWRPLLMTLICESLGGGDAAIPLSPLVEFSHTASLIHDDIEDESDERRGEPAIHKVYGVDTAINSGSFLYFLSSCCIDSYEIKDKNYIFKIWSDCLRELHLGQAMDIFWHRNISFVPSIDEYYLMAGLKTGALASLAAGLGSYAAGAEPEKTEQFAEAARKMGIGFQILDDVKNLTMGIPGKKRGDDVVEGKKSLPVLLYMDKFPQKKDMIFYYFHVAKNEGTSAPEVGEFIETVTNTGILAEAEERGRVLLKEAQDVFGSYDLLNDFFTLIG